MLCFIHNIKFTEKRPCMSVKRTVLVWVISCNLSPGLSQFVGWNNYIRQSKNFSDIWIKILQFAVLTKCVCNFRLEEVHHFLHGSIDKAACIYIEGRINMRLIRAPFWCSWNKYASILFKFLIWPYLENSWKYVTISIVNVVGPDQQQSTA